MKKSAYVIAEAGVNHNGSLEIAKKLIDQAIHAGADAVKFQTFRTDEVLVPDAPKAAYQKNGNSDSVSQYQMIKNLELQENDFLELYEYCRNKPIDFLSSPFDIQSVDFLLALDLRFMKVPSGEITNLPFLRAMSRSRVPIILSTGLSTIDEVDAAINILTAKHLTRDEIILLQCNTQYPSPTTDANLRAMVSLGKQMGTDFGFSDHTEGIFTAPIAVALGAVIIEKHFTLDKNLPGPDHRASLEPDELRSMIEDIYKIEEVLGKPHKGPTPSELPNKDIVRKSIVAKRAIAPGEIFSETNLTTKRPGSGISPMMWDEIIGTIAQFGYEFNEVIKSEELRK